MREVKAIAVYGLCPSCQEMALHDRDGYANGAENLYKCVKCDAINELDMIMRVVERKQSKTTAA